MSPVAKPSKEAVRQWLIREVAAKRPPKTPDEIRTELGWHLCAAERKVKAIK